MAKIIEIISPNSIKTLLGIPNDGISSTMRIVSAKTQDNTKFLYLKLYNKQHQLLNEIIGYILGFYLDLPQPKGYVLLLSKSEQTKIFGISNPKTDTYPVWATEQIDGKSASFIYTRCSTILKDDLSKWDKLYNTIAFDDLIANIDRNLGNLIRVSSGQYQLIDHGMLFNNHSIRSHHIDCKTINHNRLYQSCLKQRIKQHSNQSTKKIHHVEIGASARNHSTAIYKAMPEILFWTKRLTPGHERKLYKYLATRSKINDHIVMKKYKLLII